MPDITYICPQCDIHIVMQEGLTIVHYSNESHGFIVENEVENTK